MRLDFFSLSLTCVVCCWTCCRLSPTAAAAVPAVPCFLALSAIARPAPTVLISISFYSCASLLGKLPATFPPRADGGERGPTTPGPCRLFFPVAVCVCVPVCTPCPPLARRAGVCALFESHAGSGRAGGGAAWAGRVLRERDECSRRTRIMNKVAPGVFSISRPLLVALVMAGVS